MNECLIICIQIIRINRHLALHSPLIEYNRIPKQSPVIGLKCMIPRIPDCGNQEIHMPVRQYRQIVQQPIDTRRHIRHISHRHNNDNVPVDINHNGNVTTFK